MAESEEQVQDVPEHEGEDETEGKYKAPAQKSVKDIIATDADDESLQRYKEQLLKGAGGGEAFCKYMKFILMKLKYEKKERKINDNIACYVCMSFIGDIIG